MSQARPLVLGLPDNEVLAQGLAAQLGGAAEPLDVHRFPDGESRVRVPPGAAGRDVVLACTLDHPNARLVELYLAAATARDLGARRVLLAAPYLAYMRQDRSFHPGEGISAAHIGRWLSGFLDGLVTVDPHLHRIHRLDEVYRIPSRVVHAAGPIAQWLRPQLARPVLIGPDAESRQWVGEVAQALSCPWFVLDKLRRGDHDVAVHLPDVAALRDRQPVLLDDIVSSGASLLAAAGQLRSAGFGAPLFLCVHALCGAEVAERLNAAGRLVSCNSVRHPSNAIDLHRPLALAVSELLSAPARPQTEART